MLTHTLASRHKDGVYSEIIEKEQKRREELNKQNAHERLKAQQY